jgi:polysaccharide deacetylase family protein (PEP-CTERM system associated)
VNVLLTALTIDVEDWYHGHDFDIDRELWDRFEDRVEYSTSALLDILSEFDVRGTFFVLGYVCKKHPRLVRQIVSAGHELGSHGMWHHRVDRQTSDEFRRDLLQSKYLLEDITGKEINLYRAPSWSISVDSLWALEILEENGFVCDSSIQPFKTPLSGIKGAPVFPFHPVIGGKKLNLVEFPQTVMCLGRFRIPFSGGLYLRLLPPGLIHGALNYTSKTKLTMVYIHTSEIDAAQPRIKTSPVVKFVHYINLDSTEDKLRGLLKSFKLVPLGHLLTGRLFPALKVAL